MFNDIFGVSSQNIHIYMDKIVKLYNQHKQLNKFLHQMNEKMLKHTGPFLVFSEKDVQMMKDAKLLKH